MVERRALALFAALVVVLACSAAPASAGGGRLSPVQDRYEPGQTATMVGYTGASTPAAAGEPFYAYLRPAGDAPGVPLLRSDIYLGELVVERTAHLGYLQLRVSLTFDVPGDLVPGEYEVIYCDDPCSIPVVGDIVSSPLSIGVDPARRIVREWAPDEPEIANLAPGALLVGPGFQVTAGDLRAPQARPTPAPTPPAAPAAATPEAGPATPAPARARVSDDMSWPLPTALVLGSAAATALVLSRRPRPGAARLTAARSGASGERRTERAAVGRG